MEPDRTTSPLAHHFNLTFYDGDWNELPALALYVDTAPQLQEAISEWTRSLRLRRSGPLASTLNRSFMKAMCVEVVYG